MKKVTIKSISLFWVCVFIFSLIFSITAQATESTIRPPCVEDHFSKLNSLDNTDRLPPNPIGSCPYVAMSSLLMFYDAYWNEKFVDANYEWNKGTYNSDQNVLIETFNASSEASAWNSWAANNTGDEFTDDFHGFVNGNQGLFFATISNFSWKSMESS